MIEGPSKTVKLVSRGFVGLVIYGHKRIQIRLHVKQNWIESHRAVKP